MKKKTCKEYWDKIPYTSEHLWHADIHGIPCGDCINCGMPNSKWHKKLNKKLGLDNEWKPMKAKPTHKKTYLHKSAYFHRKGTSLEEDRPKTWRVEFYRKWYLWNYSGGNYTTCGAEVEDFIENLLSQTQKERDKICGKIIKIKTQSEFQNYGWSDLEDDLKELLDYLKKGK